MMPKILAVFLHQWQSSLTQGRILTWTILAAFPPAIAMMVRVLQQRLAPDRPLPTEFWESLLFAMIPLLVTMLGSYLWTTPAVSNEIERRSWGYLAVRPQGKVAMLIGKYLAAVTWVLSAGCVAIVLAILAAQIDQKLETGWLILRLTLLSAPAYAAIYLLIGTLLPRRAMVIAVVYTLVAELLISFVPALINQLTIQFRLRSLFFAWGAIRNQGEVQELLGVGLIGSASPWTHIALLALYIATLLWLATYLIRQREFLQEMSGGD